jgi:Signal transduction histidine kinase
MGGDASVAKAKREIQRNINELDQLVDEILLASRLEQPGVDVGTVESVDLIGLAAEECARVDADLEVQATEGVEVPAIAKLVRRAVRNLLENARRYSHGEVSLLLSREGDMAVIRVQDIGPGVPPISASAFLKSSTACLVPASARAAWGWACRWCAALHCTMAAAWPARAVWTASRAPALCCVCLCNRVPRIERRGGHKKRAADAALFLCEKR